MEKDKRADGRALKQLRPLTAEVNVLPPVVHGSAMFARGETMSLAWRRSLRWKNVSTWTITRAA